MDSNDIIQNSLNAVDNIPEINIYKILSHRYKSYYVSHFTKNELLAYVDNDEYTVTAGYNKYVLTPFCIATADKKVKAPIILRLNTVEKDFVEVFYFLDGIKYDINVSREIE